MAYRTKPEMRARALCRLTASALGGMMANPAWMALAKELADEPNNGDVPHQFARLSSLYAERTLIELEERNEDVKNWLNDQTS